MQSCQSSGVTAFQNVVEPAKSANRWPRGREWRGAGGRARVVGASRRRRCGVSWRGAPARPAARTASPLRARRAAPVCTRGAHIVGRNGGHQRGGTRASAAHPRGNCCQQGSVFAFGTVYSHQFDYTHAWCTRSEVVKSAPSEKLIYTLIYKRCISYLLCWVSLSHVAKPGEARHMLPNLACRWQLSGATAWARHRARNLSLIHVMKG